MQNESLLVVGAGQMGLGIVQVAAQAEMQVFLADATKELALSGKDKLSSQLQAIVNKGKITEQQKQLILTKHKELTSQMETNIQSLKDKTPAERKAALQKQKTDIETWAKQNNIDVKYLFGGFGMKMGRMHMMKK
jgi:pyruvate/2-oxoglutarate dehydrogenase complex dihydrolipoamide dehydrogenase (E3) component